MSAVFRETQEKIHRAKVLLAKQTIDNICDPEDSDFPSDEEGVGPVQKPIPPEHFHRRRIANETLDAVEQLIEKGSIDPKTVCHQVRRSLKKSLESVDPSDIKQLQSKAKLLRMRNSQSLIDVHEGTSAVPEAREVTLHHEQKNLADRRSRKKVSVAYETVKHVLNHGVEPAARDHALSDKPNLVGDIGLLCVKHLPPKYTTVAACVRDTIYDPDFYDDGTYAPTYIRLCFHASCTFDANDKTGGLEGACMRFQPEKTDAHNKGLYHVIQRLDTEVKQKHNWITHADLWCMTAYICIEISGGPVMEFTPGRRDTTGPTDWLLKNYRERGDLEGAEDEPVCPHIKKAGTPAGRLPMGEEGHLGGAFTAGTPVPKEAEVKEMDALAENIRWVFGRIFTGKSGGCPPELVVAMISGGHGFGRCHPSISGYAGPWTYNPGKFTNSYCQRLLDDDWALVDRTMEDLSGDFLTGLRPKGMRRQYVNKGGKGDLMMLPSDMALLHDAELRKWVEVYATDFTLMKKNFGVAFKLATEVGFSPPKNLGVQPITMSGILNPANWFNAEKGGWVVGLKIRLRRLKRDLADATMKDLLTCQVEICGNEERRNALAIERAQKAKEEREAESQKMVATVPKTGDPYTVEEVAKHNSKGDVWVIINGQVCNLTNFIAVHPGGEGPIMRFAGKDASTEWNAIHKPDAIEKLAKDTIIGHIK